MVQHENNIWNDIWYNKGIQSEDKLAFTCELNERLCKIEVPGSLHCENVHCTSADHDVERDSVVLDILTQVIETSHTTIPMSSGRGQGRVDPSKNCTLDSSIPGWREEVKPYKNDAAFYHAVWRCAGRPDTGPLREKMVQSRNQYHYAIRRCKRMADSIRARKLLEASEVGSLDLINEMKKIRGSKREKSDLPENVEGALLKNFEKYMNIYIILGTLLRKWRVSRLISLKR